MFLHVWTCLRANWASAKREPLASAPQRLLRGSGRQQTHTHAIADQMGCASSQPEPEPTPPPASQMRRRASAAAQGGIDPSKIVVNLATLPKIQKSDAALARIKECVSSNILCKHLAKEYKDAVIAAMKEVKLAKGEQVIKQGGVCRQHTDNCIEHTWWRVPPAHR